MAFVMADLRADEQLLGNWTSGVPSARADAGFASEVSGMLLLTNQRLIFEPSKIRRNDTLVQVTNTAISSRWHYIVLPDITGALAVPKSPKVQIDFANGQQLFYYVLANRLSPVWSKKSRLAAEDAAKRIDQAAKASQASG
jgi:hypothetical protein